MVNNHNGSIVQGKYTILNNEWGLAYNHWGTGSESCTADPGISGRWVLDFDWHNSPTVAWDEYHIKAYPSIVDGWQYGYSNPKHDFPVVVGDKKNVLLAWKFTSAPVDAKNFKSDISWDIWLDPSGNPSGAAHQEIMIWPWYTGTPEDEGLKGRIGDVTVDGAMWHVYRNGEAAPFTIDFVAVDKTTALKINLKDFLTYCTDTQKWIDPSVSVISVEAGAEIWYGSGRLITNNYSVTVK